MICGKTIYQNQQAANDAIKGQHRDKRFIKSKIKAGYSYLCDLCNGWHISSNQQKRPKVKRSQNRTETPNIANKIKHNNDVKSGTRDLVIHSRLNFKVK